MDSEHKWTTEVRATCICGWRSERTHTGAAADNAAMLDWSAHARACKPAKGQ